MVTPPSWNFTLQSLWEPARRAQLCPGCVEVLVGTETGPHRPHGGARQRGLRRRPASPHPAAHPSSQGFLDSVVLTSVLMGSEQTARRMPHRIWCVLDTFCPQTPSPRVKGSPRAGAAPATLLHTQGLGGEGNQLSEPPHLPAELHRARAGSPLTSTQGKAEGTEGDPCKRWVPWREAKGELHNLTPEMRPQAEVCLPGHGKDHNTLCSRDRLGGEAT